MKADVRETGPLSRAVDIHIEAAEIKQFIDALVSAYRRRYTIPGFRPGKAPDQVVRGRFQDDIETAIYQELVPRKIEEALAENELHPAGPGRISKIRYQSGEPLSFSVEVEIWPEFELADYEGMEVDQLVEEVSDQDVDQYLEWMRERLADLEPVDRPAQGGDLVDVDLQLIDEEGRPAPDTKPEEATIEVGSASLLPEFQAAVQNVATGETKDLKVDYPEEFANEDLKGQTRRYRMRVKQIREKKLPPLDDEFARKLEAGLDLDGLRAKVRLRMESEKRLSSRERLEQVIVDRLIQANPFDLPESSIQGAFERLAKRQREEGREVDREELERVYRPHIERAHRRELVLIKVAEREGIRIGPQEVEAELAKMAQQENRKVEEVREQIADLDRFRDFLFERRVFEALGEKVKIREVMVPSSTAGAPTGEG